jgi:hypothetical protein
VQKNEWHCFQARAKMNDLRMDSNGGSIGNSNGIAEIKVDGRIAYQDTAHVFVNDPGAGVAYFVLEHFLGGTGFNVAQEFSVYWALVAVGTQEIGPANLR